jgi:hypothetical protein
MSPYSTVGCPYCITGGFEHRTMIENVQGEFVCLCGHVEAPAATIDFRCSCARCKTKREAANIDRETESGKHSSSQKRRRGLFA